MLLSFRLFAILSIPGSMYLGMRVLFTNKFIGFIRIMSDAIPPSVLISLFLKIKLFWCLIRAVLTA